MTVEVRVLSKKEILELGLDPTEPAVFVKRSITGNRTRLRLWNIYNGILAKPTKLKKGWKDLAMVLPLSAGQLSSPEVKEYEKHISFSATRMSINKTKAILSYHPLGPEHAIALATATLILLQPLDPEKNLPAISVEGFPQEEAERIYNAVMKESSKWKLDLSRYSSDIAIYPKIYETPTIYSYNPRELFKTILPQTEVQELPTKDYTLDPRITKIKTPQDLEDYINQHLTNALMNPQPEGETLLKTTPPVVLDATTVENDFAPDEMTSILEKTVLITIRIGEYLYRNILRVPPMTQNEELNEYLVHNRELINAMGLSTISSSDENEGLTVLHDSARVLLSTSPKSHQRELEIFALPLPPMRGAYICIRDAITKTNEEHPERTLCGFVPMDVSVRKHKYKTTITLKRKELTLKYSTTKEEAQRILNAEVKEVRA